jgi:hypothetical protein
VVLYPGLTTGVSGATSSVTTSVVVSSAIVFTPFRFQRIL